MNTMRELFLQLAEVLNSGLSDTTARSACRLICNIEVSEESPYADDLDFCQKDIDTAYAKGKAQGAEDLETVAKARDDLSNKLHSMGKAAKPLTQHQKLEAKKAEEALCTRWAKLRSR